MDLKSDFAYWPVKEGLVASYPALASNEECDVVVIGGGITGALVANELTRRNLDVVVVDRRDIATGSTGATTALLQYEIDVPLCDLIEKVGKAHAERAYHLCLDAITDLEEISRESPLDCGFSRKTSLYAASSQSDVAALKNEHAARTRCGIPVEYLEGSAVGERYPLAAPALLVSTDAAVCNAYVMAHGLLQTCLSRGCRVYDRTEITGTENRGEQTELSTNRGCSISAKWVVHATGYETVPNLKEKVATLISTYALVTQPLESLGNWNRDWIFWESARPYLYLRTTDDNRILAGGEDDRFRNPVRRDASIGKKTARLMKRLQDLFPDLELEAEFAWAGTFGETADGLAYIGPVEENSRTLYALGFGGNGIIFSVIAARLLADLVMGTKHPDLEIFRFGRGR